MSKYRDTLGLVLNSRDDLGERDDIFSLFFSSKNAMLFNITNVYHNYITPTINSIGESKSHGLKPMRI